MKLYLDDCRIEKIQELFDLYPVDGVTSNPTVLKKCGRQPVEVLKKVRGLIGKDKMLMAQVISTSAEDMIREAYRIAEIIGPEYFFVKIPAVPQGIKAIKALSKEGIPTNATGIYSVSQGLMAANAGAKAMAPYISRIDNLGGSGLQVTRELQEIIKVNGYDVQIVPGSIKTVLQVLECAKYGISGVAISAEVWDTFMQNAAVDRAIEGFNHDFEALAGAGKTFLNL